MSTNVVALRREFHRTATWSPRELGEFYRVEAILIQSGLRIDTEQGISDEGDPWFAFCRADDSEVIVHIARIGRVYILASPWYERPVSGADISALVHDLVARHPLIYTANGAGLRGSNIYLHPAALLVAIVATAFFKSTDARAFAADNQKFNDGRSAGIQIRPELGTEHSSRIIILDAAQSAIILSAVVAAIQIHEPTTLEGSAFSSEHLDFSAPNSTLPATDLISAQTQVALPINIHTDSNFHMISNTPESDGSLHSTAKTVGDALPLVAILSDMSKEAQTAGNPSASPSDGSGAPPIVVITFSSSNAGDSPLPPVQAAKIYVDKPGGVEAHTFSSSHELLTTLIDSVSGSRLDDLPKLIVDALQHTLHNVVEIPDFAKTDSIANSLFEPFTNHSQQPGAVADADNLHAASTSLPEASTTPPSQAAALDAADVNSALQNFLAHTQHWSVYEGHNDIVVYDVDAVTAALNNHAASEVIESVTFDFVDGSTLSLVGLPAALLHPHDAIHT